MDGYWQAYITKTRDSIALETHEALAVLHTSHGIGKEDTE